MSNKSKRPNIWVSPRPDGRWEYKPEGAERASKVTDTKKEIVEAARDRTQRDQVELFVQRKDGTIQSRDSFGNDPCPPKDKEH